MAPATAKFAALVKSGGQICRGLGCPQQAKWPSRRRGSGGQNIQKEILTDCLQELYWIQYNRGKYCCWISQFGEKADDEIDENGELIHGGWVGSILWKYDGIRKDAHWVKATFAPDTDNIILLSNDEHFEDDIVNLFIEFIRIVYGDATLDENLKIYQKRPIYWLFDSGKKNGFKCLIYMHRYQPDTIARIRTDYVHEQQSRYRTSIVDLEKRAVSASTSEKVKFTKQLSKLQDQAVELHEYEEKIHHLADQYISTDLDDGVKVNYAKFQDVLAKIK